MSELRTEEEQVELIKKWWAENGKTVIVALVLSIAAILGWQWWQNQQQAKVEAASEAYEQMVELMSKPELTDEQKATAQHLSTQLQSEHEGTLYANYASLFKARLQLEEKKPDDALATLKAVQAAAVNETVSEVAVLRQAQILWQQGQNDQALSLLNNLKAKTYMGEVEELKGDLLTELKQPKEAKEAYLKARAVFINLGIQRPVIDMKLADLGGAGA
ncbi:Putative negative regulator of RcsB-dependent stress response [Oceanospirillum multiglobuliferum]|uniref:Ancillary SecYEG translocon subunit n=1 Tax=Oceanospirillum multiglobuliferum TaxID=64969 RepID=A0A1T4M0Y7_9GAMM|nr:tetratricopeptide repeat protein [Oceanospirillum multiglobuliferum]OPX56288.1 hypothetical protein BTE48_04760 [Oceanospirillum multiglobuliferum]SJZ60659.1 Putative negative regulator of RcsB-dependent stress response [Oceanospirillum multiglobuliferum]